MSKKISHVRRHVRMNAVARALGQRRFCAAADYAVEPLESRTLLSASYTLSTLATFNGANGAYPRASLIADANGNLYGTTLRGGTDILGRPGVSAPGTVFEVAAGTRTLTTLVAFNDNNGGDPDATLYLDASGNLYGTTSTGGVNSDGTVFELAAGTHALTTLVTFNGTNGSYPESGLIPDASGNLYGTTLGNQGQGGNYGTIFELAAGTHALTTLWSFNGTDGIGPCGNLIIDANGNLYGTTVGGGAYGGAGTGLGGTVFEFVANTHTLTTLVSFNGSDGFNPVSGVINVGGNLYGTTEEAGGSGTGVGSSGTIFEVAAGTHALTTLVSFNVSNGESPSALIADASGNFYGTTELGGAGIFGSIFEVTAGTNTLTTLVSFNLSNGSSPMAGLYADASGDLYGTTAGNGDALDLYGTVFELTPVVGQATQLVFGQQPSNTTAASTLSPAITVKVEDANGILVTTDNSTVTLSVASGPGSLQGTLTAPAVNGIATFSNLSLSTAGTYTLHAGDGSLTPATSASFIINPNPNSTATQLAFIQQPSNDSVGVILSPAITVDIEDANGNLVATNNSHVTLSLASGSGTLQGTLTVAAVHGVATFSNLSLPTVGTYTLQAADGTLTPAISTAFTLSLPIPTRVAFAQVPSSTYVGFIVSPEITVKIEDAYGHLVATNNSTATLSVASGPGILQGIFMAPVVNGIATFSNLSFPTAGTYTLQASDGSLTAATSAPFVISPPPAHLIVTGPDAGSAPLVKAFDAATGNLYYSFYPYDHDFGGGVRIATGDFNGDGVPDIVTATGAGGMPLVNVYDGKTGQMISNFYAYNSDYLGGVEVAVADVTGSGHPDIITSTDAGGMPLVQVFNGGGTLLGNFYAYATNYLGGVRIATGDFAGNGTAEIVTSTANGGQPLVNVFSSAGTLLGNCWGDSPSYTGGLQIAVGKFNNDGVANVATYRDQATFAQVKLFNLSTQSLFNAVTLNDSALPLHLRLAATDTNSDGIADLVAVPTSGNAPEVEVFSSQDGSLIRKWSAYSSTVTCGLFVAAG